MQGRWGALAIALTLIGLGAGLAWQRYATTPPPVHLPPALKDTYTVVRRVPHDPNAFTEGLSYQEGVLYESTGMPGHSQLREVNLDTGQVVRSTDLPATSFGEGSTPWGDALFMLTWQEGRGFVFDRHTLALHRTFSYAGEGWGLTQDGSHLWVSDGTSTLQVWDPNTLRVVRSVAVQAQGQPVPRLNELEWVKGLLYANVWQTSYVVRIDPTTGAVVGWVDLSALSPDPSTLPRPSDDVLNGIAYDADHGRLFVTGKRWPWLYEIQLHPHGTGAAVGL